MVSEGVKLYDRIDAAYRSVFDSAGFFWLLRGKPEHRRALRDSYQEVCGQPPPLNGFEERGLSCWVGTACESPRRTVFMVTKDNGRNYLQTLEGFSNYCAVKEGRCGDDPPPEVLAKIYARYLDGGRRCPAGTLYARREVAGAIRLDDTNLTSEIKSHADSVLGFKNATVLDDGMVDIFHSGLDDFPRYAVKVIDSSRLHEAANIGDFRQQIEMMPPMLKELFVMPALPDLGGPQYKVWDEMDEWRLNNYGEKMVRSLVRRYAYIDGKFRGSLAKRIEHDVKLICRLDTSEGELKLDVARAMRRWALGQYVLGLDSGLLIDLGGFPKELPGKLLWMARGYHRDYFFIRRAQMTHLFKHKELVTLSEASEIYYREREEKRLKMIRDVHLAWFSFLPQDWLEATINRYLALDEAVAEAGDRRE